MQMRGGRAVTLSIGIYTAGTLSGYLQHARNPCEEDNEKLMQFL
jgi:hypothetical protein